MTPLDRFTCEDAFRRLDDYLDRVLSRDEMQLVEQHLETCATCAHEYAFEAKFIDGLRTKVKRLDVSGDLMSRIQERIARAATGTEPG